MLEMTVGEVRDDFAETINKVAYGHERVVLERRGKKVAVMVSVEDAELLERLEDQIDIAAAKKALASKKRIPYDEARKDLGL